MRIRPLLEQNSNQLLSSIRSECSDYLSSNDPVPIYRGMKRQSGKKQISERFPKHTTATGSTLFNLIIEHQFDITGVRHKGTYTSTSWQDASEYGPVHFVFPINNTQCLYNPGVPDSITLVRNIESSIKSTLQNLNSEKAYYHFTDLVNKTNDVDLEDVKNLPEGNKLYQAIEDEIAFGNILSDYHLTTPDQLPENSSQYRGYEVLLFDSSYYYVVSFADVAQSYYNEVDEEPNDIQAAYEYLLEKIEDGEEL